MKWNFAKSTASYLLVKSAIKTVLDRLGLDIFEAKISLSSLLVCICAFVWFSNMPLSIGKVSAIILLVPATLLQRDDLAPIQKMLPSTLLLNIFHLLDPATVAEASCVCR